VVLGNVGAVTHNIKMEGKSNVKERIIHEKRSERPGTAEGAKRKGDKGKDEPPICVVG